MTDERDAAIERVMAFLPPDTASTLQSRANLARDIVDAIWPSVVQAQSDELDALRERCEEMRAGARLGLIAVGHALAGDPERARRIRDDVESLLGDDVQARP